MSAVTLVANNPLDAVPVRNNPVIPSTPTLWEKIRDTALAVFKFIETIFWKYAEEASYFAQHVITVITETCSELAAKLNPIIAKIGILSFITGLFALKSVPSNVESLIDHIKTRDGENAAFSAMSLLVAPFEVLDSVISTAGALAAFGAIPTVAFFSLISLPLAIGLVGYSAFKGLYDIIRCSINLNELPAALGLNNLADFHSYLKSKIGVTEDEKGEIERKFISLKTTGSDAEYRQKIKYEFKILKDRKRNLVSAHTDEKIVSIMKNLKKHLKLNPTDVDTANDALEDMKTIMSRKITWGAIGLANNIAYVVTLACSAVFPISALAIPIVGGVRAAFAIAKHHYMHAWLDSGLNVPNFAN